VDWIDTAGRWLIIGLGLAVSIVLLGYMWKLAIGKILWSTRAIKNLSSYLYNRHKFRSWEADRKEWEERNDQLWARVRELEHELKKARGGHEKE